MRELDPRRAGNVVAGALLLALAVVLVRTAWVSDDAYITLRTVDNLVHGFGPRWNVDERVQAYTHPLWMLALAAAYAATREAYLTTLALGLAASLATAFWLAWPRRGAPALAALALAPLLLSRSFVDYATSGMENPLAHLILVAFVASLFRSTIRPGALALLAGLLALTRTDLALLAAPATAWALVRRHDRREVAAAAAALAPLAAWHGFALVYYGSPWPNTALAKLATGIPTGELLAQGVAYLRNAAVCDPVLLPVVGFAVLRAVQTRSARALALAGGLALYLAYVVGVGGDFMSGRFLTAPLVVATALLAEIGWSASKAVRLAAIGAVAVLGFLAPHPTLLSGPRDGDDLAGAVDARGIADERRMYFAASGLLNGRSDWVRPASGSVRAGDDMRGGGARLAVGGAIGYAGYAAGPGVHIVDFHALTDPLLARLPMVARDAHYAEFLARHGITGPAPPWRPGHFVRDVPRGYLNRLAGGTRALETPETEALWEAVERVTRGPLWTAARWGDIAALNLVAVRGRVPGARTDRRAVDWDEILAAQPYNTEALYQKGRALQAAGDAAGARALYTAALERYPGHVRAREALSALRGAREED